MAVRAGTADSGLVQLPKVTAEIDPAPKPGSPLPLSSVAFTVTDVQVKMLPVLVSLKLTLVAVDETAPPGLMVHVVAANAAVALRMAASRAAEPAIRGRA
jgi:hypothetical protein